MDPFTPEDLPLVNEVLNELIAAGHGMQPVGPFLEILSQQDDEDSQELVRVFGYLAQVFSKNCTFCRLQEEVGIYELTWAKIRGNVA